MDTAGNAATNNFTIMPSALTLTINSTPTGDDLYQPSGTVSGTVGDPDAVVTVNGVTAAVDDTSINGDGTYNWSADLVSIYGMGTATFDATAAPGSGSGLGMARAMDAGSGSGANASVGVEMGPILTVTHYTFTEVDEQVEYRDGPPPIVTRDTQTMTYDGKLAPNSNGQWQQTYRATETTVSSGWGDCSTNARSWSDPEPFNPDGFYGADEDVDASTYAFTVGHNFAKTVHHHWDYYNPVDGPVGCADATVGANTRWTLYTGGKAPLNPPSPSAIRAGGASGSSPQNLFAISAWANSYEASPTGPDGGWGLFWYEAPINGVLAAGVQVLGGPLGSDYTRWTMQSANAAVDLGLNVPGKNDSGAGGAQGKYKLIVSANGTPLDPEPFNAVMAEGLQFANGQFLAVVAKGQFAIHRPQLEGYSHSAPGEALLHHHPLGEGEDGTDLLKVWKGAEYSVGVNSLFNGEAHVTQTFQDYLPFPSSSGHFFNGTYYSPLGTDQGGSAFDSQTDANTPAIWNDTRN